MEILRWMTRHGVTTTEQVAVKFFWREELRRPGLFAAYRRLAALRQLGLVISDKKFVDRPAALRVTQEGARLADVGVAPAPLVLSQLHHSLQLVDLTEAILREHPEAELNTERELRAEQYRQRQDGTRPKGRGRGPDAIVRLPKKGGRKDEVETIAVELDISRKDRREMERMITAYDYEKVDRVWWYVTPERMERVQEVVRALRAERRIEVRPWRG